MSDKHKEALVREPEVEQQKEEEEEVEEEAKNSKKGKGKKKVKLVNKWADVNVELDRKFFNIIEGESEAERRSKMIEVELNSYSGVEVIDPITSEAIKNLSMIIED